MFKGDIEVGPDRRTLSLIEVPTRFAAAGLAQDKDETARMKAALERESTIRAEILDRIDTAVAVFDSSRRLTFCNRAYRDLWHFDPAWIITKPDFDEVLEKLRAEERVPTPADGQGWREWAASLIDPEGGEVVTSDWDLPNASLSLKLVTIPHRDGGSTHLFHDLTESLDLQTRLSAQASVQRQTLESLSEAIAVFGQDGKLKLSNPQFARMWNLDPKTLTGQPHIDGIIARCRELHDNHEDWLALKQSVCSFLDEREPGFAGAGAARRHGAGAVHGAAFRRGDAGGIHRHHRRQIRRTCAARAQRSPGTGRGNCAAISFPTSPITCAIRCNRSSASPSC